MASWRRSIAVGGRLGVTLSIGGLAAASWWPIRAAWADWRARVESPAALEAAIQIAPDNALYHLRLANLLGETDPARAIRALQAAVKLNPSDSRAWMDLGQLVEEQGDVAEAEGFLLRAADVDRQYLPSWTLANFYLRHGNTGAFWWWAKAAAEMGYGDWQPLFSLCGSLGEDGRLIDRLNLRRPEARAAYLSYLLGLKRPDLIARAVEQVGRDNRDADVSLLLEACDRWLDAGRLEEAAGLWNRLAQNGRVPFETPGGEGPELLGNPRFSTVPLSRGFDWRLPGVEGIVASREEGGGLRLTFSGGEPEQCEVLAQLVPILESADYLLEFEYRTSGLRDSAGLGWRISDASRGDVLLDGPSLSSAEYLRAQAPFRVISGRHLLRVALIYKRALGTTRLEGHIVLRSVTLHRAS